MKFFHVDKDEIGAGVGFGLILGWSKSFRGLGILLWNRLVQVGYFPPEKRR